MFVVCVCMCACGCVCLSVCVCLCVYMRMRVHAPSWAVLDCLCFAVCALAHVYVRGGVRALTCGCSDWLCRSPPFDFARLSLRLRYNDTVVDALNDAVSCCCNFNAALALVRLARALSGTP